MLISCSMYTKFSHFSRDLKEKLSCLTRRISCLPDGADRRRLLLLVEAWIETVDIIIHDRLGKTLGFFAIWLLG